MSQPTSAVQPGRSLGWITLGSSLHSIVSRVKSLPQTYPKIDLSYSSSQPLVQPVILNLPANGLRLRFDGPDQRLRLIEVLDFSASSITYKSTDLVKRSKSSDDDQVSGLSSQRPTFKHIYNRLFGPAYEGEYLPPDPGHSIGTYTLSYPGLAFTFPVQHKSWSDKADFVSILSSVATGPAISMAIFSGPSWPEARSILFNKVAAQPRSTSVNGKASDGLPDDIDDVKLYGAGRLEFVRRGAPSTMVQLNETTPQSLIAEFGPPDAIYRKNDNRISIHAGQRTSSRRGSSLSPALDPTAVDTDHSSLQSYTDDSDVEPSDSARSSTGGQNLECFYNYFYHGFDALVTYPASKSPAFPGVLHADISDVDSSHLVVTKIILHGNVPGSYSFNRHRRCRWSIHTTIDASSPAFNSEMPFSEVSELMKDVWRESYGSSEEERQMQRGMVLNRGWGQSPDSSIELLGGFDDAPIKQQGQAAVMNNTDLFGFPGMLFEVLKNDSISALTVY
ncbi:uncharacterized protein HMPREF1541_06230 [Cyphellophora europaea CBS 101466]|uniref:Isoleucyl-tRNA synthetase n=1 Tax=Cyphellophora europaea (strain CBS 101466) TaxID=1220924 RepID=W2RR40_CYPE1|nr:uncharacterized protein HMPREF1541_06230 [Cyphellophora europaea CBS 101466]ETN38199.1 hypothetical protein HMPREF1541_06230 [Cyphellophora europaea CBS 101466]